MLKFFASLKNKAEDLGLHMDELVKMVDLQYDSRKSIAKNLIRDWELKRACLIPHLHPNRGIRSSQNPSTV